MVYQRRGFVMGKSKILPLIFAALFLMVVLDTIQVVQPIMDEKPVLLASLPVHGPVTVVGKASIGLAEIMQLEPVQTILGDGRLSAGFTVENVENIIVNDAPLPDWYVATLADRPIVSALVNAVKNQQGQIDDIVYTVHGLIQ
jgi:hypothetical protein